jgi:spore coat protein A, manganese oxidase
MGITRRDAIKLGLAAGGSLLSPLSFPEAAAALAEKPVTLADLCGPLPKFQDFQRPPELQPTRSTNGTDYYEITLKKGKKKFFLGNQEAEIWGYEGITPGPTIRQRAGRESKITFTNRLGDDDHGKEISSVVHLHGMESLPYYDGYALDCIPPDYFKEYVYPNPFRGTLWYHDHTIDKTSRNVHMGLAGMYIVESDDELGLKLPQGEYDVPLILQDQKLPLNQQLHHAQSNSFYGDVISVNGVAWPEMAVERRKYRFRILNASVSRTFRLSLSQSCEGQTVGDVMTVIACDESFLWQPAELKSPYKTLKMGVAERYEVIIDFAQYEPHAAVYLRNAGFTGSIDTDTRTYTVMKFKVGPADHDASEIPLTFKQEVEPLPIPRNQTPQRTFRFGQSGKACAQEPNPGSWTINGQVWNADRFAAQVEYNAVEIWEFINTGSGWIHPVHPHLVRFQILSRNGLPPKPYECGWKDVVLVGESQRVRVLAKFGDHESVKRSADMIPREGIYMMHCHNLVHEDHMMMTQFKVGTGGESPLARPAQPIDQNAPHREPPYCQSHC